MTDGHVSRLTVRLITGMYKCTCVCLYRFVCGGASAAQFGGCSMHLASDVHDLLTRPSASTEPAAAVGEIREGEEQSEEPGSKPSTFPYKYTHLHDQYFHHCGFFICSASNKNSAKDVISPVRSTIQEERRGQRDVSLPVMSPESVTASE